MTPKNNAQLALTASEPPPAAKHHPKTTRRITEPMAPGQPPEEAERLMKNGVANDVAIDDPCRSYVSWSARLINTLPRDR